MNTQLEELYSPLFQYVRKRINNQEDAEDLTQEVFLKLSKSRMKDVENLKSWIYTIARNTITDFYRKKKIYTEEVGDSTPADDYNDNEAVRELSGCIASYVDQLPEEYREVMRLSELDGVPQKEIAELLNMNYVTVRSRIQRGRKKIKEIFSKCCTIHQGAGGSILDYQKKNGCGDPESGCSEENHC